MSDNGHTALDEPLVFAEDVVRPVGDTGLQNYGGVLYDYQYRRLSGDDWLRAVMAMMDSPVVKGMLFAVEMLIRRAEWQVQPAEGEGISADKAEEVAEFVESARGDMHTPWEDTLASVLSFLPYGYSVFEIIYKRRLGPDTNQPSAHDDGKIGWDDWSPRPQDTIAGWNFDDFGRPNAVKQRKKGNYGTPVEIPLRKCLHFRAGGYKGSPEGESALRSAWVDWDAIQKLQTTEAIGIERDLAGLPVALVPPRYLAANRSSEAEAFYRQIRKIVTGIRNNDASGVVFPLSYDSSGKPEFEFKLMSSGGGRQFDTSAVVARRTSQMTMALLADFMTLGHGATGSYALARDKTELFEVAISAWLDMIANVIVIQGFRQLLKVNAIDLSLCPGLIGLPPDSEDLALTGQYIGALMPLITAAGVEREDLVELVNHLFGRADFPQLTRTVEVLDEEPDEPEVPDVPLVPVVPEPEDELVPADAATVAIA